MRTRCSSRALESSNDPKHFGSYQICVYFLPVTDHSSLYKFKHFNVLMIQPFCIAISMIATQFIFDNFLVNVVNMGMMYVHRNVYLEIKNKKPLTCMKVKVKAVGFILLFFPYFTVARIL